MNKLVAALALGTAGAETFVEGGVLGLTWKDCGDASTKAKISGLTPTSLTLGQKTTVTGSGKITEGVSDGKIAVSLKASIISKTYSGDVCTGQTFTLPLGVGSIQYDGVKCPLAAGAVDVPVEVLLFRFVIMETYCVLVKYLLFGVRLILFYYCMVWSGFRDARGRHSIIRAHTNRFGTIWLYKTQNISTNSQIIDFSSHKYSLWKANVFWKVMYIESVIPPMKMLVFLRIFISFHSNIGFTWERQAADEQLQRNIEKTNVFQVLLLNNTKNHWENHLLDSETLNKQNHQENTFSETLRNQSWNF